MFKGWVIALACSAILFFVLYYVFSSLNYKRRFKEQYDLRNHFPYEFNYEGRFSDNILGNICLLFSSAFSLAVFAVATADKYNNGFVIAALGSGSLLAILAVVINFVPLKYIKAHILFMVLLFVSAFASPALIGFAFFRHFQDFKDTISLVLFIVSVTVALFLFVLIMNPKLSLNIPMKKATDEKGNEYYVRPKIIVIAFSEWMMLYSMLISELLIVLLLNVIG